MRSVHVFLSNDLSTDMTASRRILTFSLVGLSLLILVTMPAWTWFFEQPESLASSDVTVAVETYAEGLSMPWGMAFLPDGRMLVTERGGTIRLVGTNGSVSEALAGVPEVCACGQGGLLDIALHPEYETNGWIYITYSDKRVGNNGRDLGYTTLMRARLDGMALVDQETLYQADEKFYTRRGQHFGSRIVFDDEGYVYFSIGDRGQRDQVQDLSVPHGKVHRLHDDGRVPEDNPFVDTPDAIASIWSYGHRNQQGMAVHPTTRDIWATEHGPRGGDELNVVRKGLNYGWPVITYGINYNGSSITDLTEKEGMEQPATHWTPSIAVCGIDFYTGEAFPEWQNSLLVTSLKFSRLERVVLDGDRVVSQEIISEPGGRLRDVQTGPDGYIYIAVEAGEDNSTIIRLVPAS